MKKTSIVTGIALGVVLLVIPLAAHACAVCLAGAGTTDPLNDAFNWSVLFLMATPYTVLGSIGGWLFYNYWRAYQRRGGLGKKLPVLNLVRMIKESAR